MKKLGVFIIILSVVFMSCNRRHCFFHIPLLDFKQVLKIKTKFRIALNLMKFLVVQKTMAPIVSREKTHFLKSEKMLIFVNYC